MFLTCLHAISLTVLLRILQLVSLHNHNVLYNEEVLDL